jgi:hypothetical protein
MFTRVFLLCVFYFCSSFLRVFLTNQKRGEKSNQKISREERTSESKSAQRGGLFLRETLYGLIKRRNASYKHTAFDVNLDRKQTKKTLLLLERERERI